MDPANTDLNAAQKRAGLPSKQETTLIYFTYL